MKYEALEKLRRRLLDRRLSLLRLHAHTVAEAAELRDEREADWPDVAALATSASLLEHLGETERAEVVRIDEALARMERGAYGDCVSCGAEIELDRLEVVPESDRCERCANR